MKKTKKQSKLKNLILNSFKILSEPKKSFIELKERKFEDVLTQYLILIFSFGIFAGIVYFIFSIGKAYYLDIFQDVYVDYFRLANYSLGNSASIIFFYFFAGTFLVGFITLVLNTFIKKINLVSLMKISMYAALPLILFAWIPTSIWPMVIWALFLLVTGIKTFKQKEINKHSIHQRD